MHRFQDQTVVVTGASRGLGRAIATAFGREGAHVFVGFRAREADAEATLQAIREAGGAGTSMRIDLRDPASVEAAMTGVIDARGGIDVLVNNAGITRDAFFPLMPIEAWEEVVGVNLTGTFLCCRAVVRTMMARGRGAIVNVGSAAGHRASAGQANYSASKGGVEMLTRTLAAELAPRGIRVNAVVPGMIAAGMAERLDRRLAERRRQAIPLGRFGEAEEVADAVLFLASDQARYVIGQCLGVDGGLTL